MPFAFFTLRCVLLFGLATGVSEVARVAEGSEWRREAFNTRLGRGAGDPACETDWFEIVSSSASDAYTPRNALDTTQTTQTAQAFP